jgi:RNA polymerase sigma factor (sigma-70 family)
MTPLLSSTLLRTQTDERLVALAAAGHDRAFEAIVERYRRPLLRYLRRLLSDMLAEDVVQATFINAWSSLRTGTEVRELRPWLYRIAHNAAINALKKVGEAMEEMPESVGGFATEPATELERRDEMQRALTSIAALPSRQRAALLAVAVDGRAHSDVAAELGLTDGAVRQLVHRARTTLRTGVTAITPLPLLHAVVASAGDSTVARVAEVAAGAGGAGAASVSLKAGAAAVLATGALVTGGPKVAHVVHPSQRPSATATQASSSPSRPTASASVASPAAATAAAAKTKHEQNAAASSGRSHRQRHRGHNAAKSSGAAHSSRHRSSDSRRDGSSDSRRRGTNSGETTSGRRHRGSGSSGGEEREAEHTGTSGSRETTSGRRDRSSGSGSRESGSGTGGGTRTSGGGGDDLLVKPPTTTTESGGGESGSGHVDPVPAPTPTTTTVSPMPTAPTTTGTTGGGEIRSESSGSGGGGGGG